MEGRSLLIEFYDARDQLLGMGNYEDKQDVEAAYARYSTLATKGVEEAQWFLQFGGFDINVRYFIYMLNEYIYAGFAVDKDIARAHAYMACFDHNDQHALRAANMGNALGQGLWAESSEHVDEAIEYATKSASQGDRHGMWQLGYHLEYVQANPSDDDRVRACEAYKAAAELGYNHAMVSYGRLAFSKFNPERYVWYKQAAHAGQTNGMRSAAFKMCRLYTSGYIQAGPAVYAIGRAIELQTDKQKGIVFDEFTTEMEFKYACKTIEFYLDWTKKARQATYTWLLCAKRLKLYRDIALLIARHVWHSRSYAYCTTMRKYGDARLKRL